MHRLLVVAIALVSVAPGCSGSSDEPPIQSSNESSNVLLRRVEVPNSGPSARPSGTLEIDLERGCILLSGRPVVWPRETTLTTEPLELRLPGGLTARSGDVVAGGGGGMYAWMIPRTEIRFQGDLDKALDCAPKGTAVVVFNPRGPMYVSPGMLVTHAVNVDVVDARETVGGTLELDVDQGCILLSGKPVLWPNETTLTTKPVELHLPSGFTARSGDVVRGRGAYLPAARISRTSMWIEGDLENALACARPGSEVVVFRAPGSHMTVSPRR